MQNIPPELIITVENYIYITSFKMKGSPDLGQADMYIRRQYSSHSYVHMDMTMIHDETTS